MTQRYIEWDFDRGMATEFERLGECNGCGDCCQGCMMFVFQKPDGPSVQGYGAVTGKGVWQEVSDGDRRIFRQFSRFERTTQRCSELTVENRCAIHESKPGLCALWPVVPTDIAPFPRCGYAFRIIREWSIEAIV